MWHWLRRWFQRSKPTTTPPGVDAAPRRITRVSRVAIAQGVLRSIEDGYRQHLESPRGHEETAWLLLGHRGEDSIRIHAAVPAGANRDASSVHVRFDTSAQALAACILRTNDPRLVPLGVFHTHPGSLDHPSSGDYQGDSVWVQRLPCQTGIFGIGTSDGGPRSAGFHQKKVGKLCLSWYTLAVGDATYAPIEIRSEPGEDQALCLSPVWDTVEQFADPLLGLARQLAKARYEIAHVEQTPTLVVAIPIRETEANLRLVFHPTGIRYYLGWDEHWLSVDPAESDPELAVYRLLPEVLQYLRRIRYNAVG